MNPALNYPDPAIVAQVSANPSAFANPGFIATGAAGAQHPVPTQLAILLNSRNPSTYCQRGSTIPGGAPKFAAGRRRGRPTPHGARRACRAALGARIPRLPTIPPSTGRMEWARRERGRRLLGSRSGIRTTAFRRARQPTPTRFGRSTWAWISTSARIGPASSTFRTANPRPITWPAAICRWNVTGSSLNCRTTVATRKSPATSRPTAPPVLRRRRRHLYLGLLRHVLPGRPKPHGRLLPGDQRDAADPHAQRAEHHRAELPGTGGRAARRVKCAMAAGYQSRRNDGQFNPDILQSRGIVHRPGGRRLSDGLHGCRHLGQRLLRRGPHPRSLRQAGRAEARARDRRALFRLRATDAENTWKALINWQVNDLCGSAAASTARRARLISASCS